jgi:hypothetical protein
MDGFYSICQLLLAAPLPATDWFPVDTHASHCHRVTALPGWLDRTGTLPEGKRKLSWTACATLVLKFVAALLPIRSLRNGVFWLEGCRELQSGYSLFRDSGSLQIQTSDRTLHKTCDLYKNNLQHHFRNFDSSIRCILTLYMMLPAALVSGVYSANDKWVPETQTNKMFLRSRARPVL